MALVSASDSDSDEWPFASQSSSSSGGSDDDNGRSTDTFAAADSFEKLQVSSSRLPLRQRGRHGRNTSIVDIDDRSVRAYNEALRSVRASSHRGSISVASSGGAPHHLSDDTRRRHRESKQRLQCADTTQKLLLRAHELDQFIDSVPLWLHASVVPPRWRVQIVTHLTAIHAQTQFCRGRVLAVWHLLLPPFDPANAREFEQRLALFEQTISSLEAAITQCQDCVAEGERVSASTFIQTWYRRCLARRGFYTKALHVTSRRSRGLIPGLFDTIAATSRLTIHPGTPHRSTLEYPTSPAMAKHAFRS
jgi:hypothetical protein